MIHPSRLVTLDLETHKIQPGLLAPPLVCGSVARAEPGSEQLLDKQAALDAFERYLHGPEWIAGANIAYDFGVAAVEREQLLRPIFEKYRRGEVFDVLIGVALDAVAGGHLFKNPETGAPLQSPKTGKRSKRYSLDIATRLVLGRYDAKANDTFRTRYATLEHVPIAQWPAEAVQYPKDDVRNTWDVAGALLGVLHVPRHDFGEGLNCLHCGLEIPFGEVPPCPKAPPSEPARNLGWLKWEGLTERMGERVSHMTHQARAAWAMHLGSVWGMRTDGAAVDAVAARVEADHVRALAQFKDTGILRENGKKNTAQLKRLTAIAYGASEKCETCEGSGKVPSPKQPRSKINCKACSGSGLVYPESLPLTEKGAISTARDTLAESGDDVLEEFATVSETAKLRDTYLPFLRQGVHKPINVTGNVLLESGRGSYDGLVQLLPRKGGIRECFVARPGRGYCSVDYGALELSTLAQVCLWSVGASVMADAINRGEDLHARFAAKMASESYESFSLRIANKDPVAKAFRQMTKAANFGFPGGMGAAALVLAKRKEGLRFCIAAGLAPPCEACGGEIGHLDCRRCYGRGALCGLEKITSYKRKPIPPACRECIGIAEDLRKLWFDMWPEMETYFEWINAQLAEYPKGLGVLDSLGTGFERGGLNFTNAANHGFQHLAAAGAKHALWRVSYESYCDDSSPLYAANTRPLIFVHDEVFSELDLELAHLAAPRKAEVMIKAMREFVPDVAIRAEPAIALRWFKDMEPVHDAAGRLIPWTPKPKNKGERKVELYVQRAA